MVDGGGVANDINDAAELHHAAEQAALILNVDNSQSGPHASYMFGVILIPFTMISLKSTYQVIHEEFSTGPRNHQALRGYVVHLK